MSHYVGQKKVCHIHMMKANYVLHIILCESGQPYCISYTSNQNISTSS